MIELLLLAQAPAEGPTGSAPFGLIFLQIAFFILIFYFLLIRPQQKRAKEHQKLVESVKTGDRVVSAGGIHGLVAQVKDKTIMLKIADGVRVELEKSSITTLYPATAESEKAAG